MFVKVRHYVGESKAHVGESKAHVGHIRTECTVKPVIYDHRVIRPPLICDQNLKDQYSLLHSNELVFYDHQHAEHVQITRFDIVARVI